MNIQKTQYQPNFQAKFMYSDDLKRVVEYAVEHGNFDKLNSTRKGMEKSYLNRRLMLSLGETLQGHPFMDITIFKPKRNISIPTSLDDYCFEQVVRYISDKKCNPLKFAYDKIMQIAKGGPSNKMYKQLLTPPPITGRYQIIDSFNNVSC